MRYMRDSGMERAVLECAAKGVPVFGICGGYQMMGKVISDPQDTECGGSIEGMGLLDSETVFEPEKRQTQVTGKFGEVEGFFSCLSGAGFYGYEIHMGRTEQKGSPLTDLGGGFAGNCAGCYVHGIFDSGEVSGRLVEALFAAKGEERRIKATDRRAYREGQLELLADAVENSLDMGLIYRILEEGI